MATVNYAFEYDEESLCNNLVAALIGEAELDLILNQQSEVLSLAVPDTQ